MEGKIARRLAAGVLVGAALVSGCDGNRRPEGQVGPSDIVDCSGELKNNSTFINLPSGSKQDFSNHFSWGAVAPDFRILSLGNGYFRLDDSNEPLAKMAPNGTVVFDSTENIHYEVKMSEGPLGTTRLDIALNCIPQPVTNQNLS